MELRERNMQIYNLLGLCEWLAFQDYNIPGPRPAPGSKTGPRKGDPPWPGEPSSPIEKALKPDFRTGQLDLLIARDPDLAVGTRQEPVVVHVSDQRQRSVGVEVSQIDSAIGHDPIRDAKEGNRDDKRRREHL